MRSRRLAPAVLSILLAGTLAGCATGQRGAPPRDCEEFARWEASEGPVEIRVAGDGSTLEVVPDTVRVRRGRPITWTSRHPFVVFVQESGDVGRPTPEGVYARGEGGGRVRAPTRSRAACGPYKYDVALYVDGEMVGLDPQIWLLPE